MAGVVAWRRDEREVARLLDQAEVDKWLKHDLVVGPGEGAVIIKNGEPQEPITESRQKLGGWSDRYLGNFKNILSAMGLGGGAGDYRVLMFSTDPFALEYAEQFITVDRLEVDAQVILRCSVVPENAVRLLATLGEPNGGAEPNFLQNLGAFLRKHMGTSPAMESPGLKERLRPDLIARVFQPLVGSMRGDELRGNTELLSSMETTARQQCEQALGAWGLRLDAMTVLFGLTGEDKAEIARKRRQLEDEEREFGHTRALREMERGAELQRVKQEMLLEERRRAEAGEVGVAALKMDAQLSAEQKQQGARLRAAQLGAQLAQIDTDMKISALAIDRERDRLAIDRKKEELALIKDRELFSHEQDRLDFEMIQREKRERTRVEQEHELNILRAQQAARQTELDMQLQQMGVQAGMIERVMNQGMASGAVNADVIQTMLREQTKMRAVDRGEGVANAAYGAEAAANSVKLMRETQADERQHQHQMTNLSANLMEAAKQPAMGMPIGAMAAGPAPVAHVVNVHSGAAAPAPGAACPHCGGRIEAGWKACPACGNMLAPEKG